MLKLASVWNELSFSRKAILVGVLVTTLIVCSAVMNMATKPRMAFLYGGLDASAAGDVLSALEAMDVEADVRGEAIYVPEPRRDALRMALARQGLPRQGQPGFELLDDLNGFATTSEMFDAAYWRAKEGELARTLLATPGVKSARVHIAVPKSSSFTRRRQPPSASATITMSRGRLDVNQATAMRYLIALAVPNLNPEQVAVIDSVNGVILKPGAGDPMEVAEGEVGDRERKLEGSLRDLLEARVGPGNARVTVSLDIDRERETVSERILDPDSRVMMGRETTDMSESGTGGTSAVTVASNLPDGEAGGAQTPSSNSRSETNETTRFDISEVQRQREKMPGAISRVHVAVLINEPPAVEGEAVTPRTDQELQSIRDLVTAAVGFEEARGDVVTVKSMPFHEYEVVETPEETGGIMLFLQQNVMSILQIVIPALVVIVLGMFVLKPVLTQDVAGGGAQALADMSGTGANAAPQLAAPKSPLDELRDASAADKEATATVLKSWLGDTERAA